MKLLFTLILSIFLCQSAFGCSNPPKAYFYSPDELVKNAAEILLARAVYSNEIENSNATHLAPKYSAVGFEVVEILKGVRGKKRHEMKGYNPGEQVIVEFGNHDENQFWENPMSGSGVTTGDCWAYGTYEVGAIYLLFTKVGNTRAFERIENTSKDKWLRKIRKITDGATKAHNKAM